MKPYDPSTLADRWGCSAMTVRNLCSEGKLRHFRLGRLYRIPAAAVEEYEWQTLQSADCAADTVSYGARMESDDAISLRHAPEKKRKQKP